MKLPKKSREFQELYGYLYDHLELIKGCIKLAKHLGNNRVRPEYRRPDEEPSEFVYIQEQEHECTRDESSMRINPRTGQIIYATWETSGHNGDSYDHKEVELTIADSRVRLINLRARLEEQCLAKEEARLQAAEDKRRLEIARSNLRAHIGKY